MQNLASLFLGSLYAVIMLFAINFIDFNANVSEIKLALFEINDSNECVKASIPVEAVILAGKLIVIIGSKITKSGKKNLLTIPTFNSSSGIVTIALGVTSDPVPVVDGINAVGYPES